MKIIFSLKELHILKKISKAASLLQVEAYLIGGFVRDKILNRPCNDMDIVCVGDGIALAHETAKLFTPNLDVNFFKTYGTAQINVAFMLKKGDGSENEPIKEFVSVEFVGARKESYAHHSRNPLVEVGTLKDDQDRRDFTINALAICINEGRFGEMLDPFNGIKDMEDGVIRTPTDPDKTYSDDPLRMLRAVRFAAQLQYSIDSDSFESIKTNAERIKIITQERITTEINKIILSAKPSIGFDLLMQTGLLHIIFPEMVALEGTENVEGMGHKDNFYHTLQVLDNIALKTKDLWLRWAAILHDIGKPIAKRFEVGHGWTFHGHEIVGAKMVKKIFTKLKLPLGEQMLFVKKMVEMHHRPVSVTKEDITDSAIRRLLYDAGDDFEPLMLLCEADITSKNQLKVKRYLTNFLMVRDRCKYVEEKDHIRSWQPPISGIEIMNIFQLKPSKMVGILKDSLKDAILDGEVENTMEAAKFFILNKGASLGLKVQIP